MKKPKFENEKEKKTFHRGIEYAIGEMQSKLYELAGLKPRKKKD